MPKNVTLNFLNFNLFNNTLDRSIINIVIPSVGRNLGHIRMSFKSSKNFETPRTFEILEVCYSLLLSLTVP